LKGVFFSLVCGSFLDFFNLLDLASGIVYFLVFFGILNSSWVFLVYGLLVLKGLNGIAMKSL
jgi:hypothetical protein